MITRLKFPCFIIVVAAVLLPVKGTSRITSRENVKASTSGQHPLDPLTSEEIQLTVFIMRRTRPVIKYEGTWVFNSITLKEPDKSTLLGYFLKDQDPPYNTKYMPRKSFAVLVEQEKNVVNEVVVNLYTKMVESWSRLPEGTQPTYTVEENNDSERVAKEDPEVRERCRQMGWTNMSLVVGETWGVAYGDDRPEFEGAVRPIQVYFYGRMFEGDNHYAHPFDFVVTVDLATRKVIAIDDLPIQSGYDIDNREGNTCPKEVTNYHPAFNPAFNSIDRHNNVNPVRFCQPDGASYKIRGNEVTWHKFKFRVGFSGREGLIIHQVSYKDGNRRRPLFYRMSLAELFIPYGDPRPPFHQKFAFDMQEFGIGYYAINQKDADICRGGIATYIDIHLNDEQGDIISLPAAVCIHEEEAGILWAHMTREGHLVHTRSQRLTVSCMINEGNYDYKFSWRFYQDATIEFNSELHGVVSSQLLAANVTDAGDFANLIHPQISGQYHQHHLAFRLDADIDGNLNTVSTLDVVPIPEPSGSLENPYGNGFTVKEEVLVTPEKARTRISPLTGRTWLIKNPSVEHPFTKKPVGWKLLPYNAPLPFVREDSPMYPKSAVMDYNMWVTEYNDEQLYPNGYYINATDTKGLPEWIEDDPSTNLTKADVVLWYIYGITHLPQTEDYPVVSGKSAGFFLKPFNFFQENPALDVLPPSRPS